MQEWLDETMHTLLDGQAAGHVFEIGTGTGMVLFNLGDGLQSYVGLEPSLSAATFVNDTIKIIPALAGKAEIHIGTATDTSRLVLDRLHPDLVVVNSVLQYFPTPEYLVEVIDTLAQISGVKRLFFGDIRPNGLNSDFLAARTLHALGEKATKDGVRRKMAEMEEREEELLIDPAFFTGLASRLPARVQHVEILPKRMEATNELSSYRYAAVVHIRSSQQQAQPVHPIDTETWVDFAAAQMDRHALQRLLQSSRGALTVPISNIPHSKTILERCVVESLDEDDVAQGSLDGAAWVSAVRRRAEDYASLSATDLIRLGEEAGFRVELSWARQRSQNGALDAVFHHYLPAREGESRVFIQFPTDHQTQPSGSLTNRPLQRLQSRRIEAKIRERLQTLLPSYMVPARIVVLDQMPVNANGKVDRQKLASKSSGSVKKQGGLCTRGPTQRCRGRIVRGVCRYTWYRGWRH